MKVLMIIAFEGYQDKEYEDAASALRERGAEITIASTDKGQAQGKFGGVCTVDMPLDEVEVEKYDTIVYIGGPGAEAFQQNPEAARIARDAVRSNRLLAAICIAPTALAAADVIQGKRVTGWDDGKGTQVRMLEAAGATFVHEDVVLDDRLITANGPMAARKFGETIADALS